MSSPPSMELVIRALRCPPPDQPHTIEARFGANGGRIGRYYGCVLPLRDPEHFISREHLDVRLRDGRFVLQVVSQVNGAIVNDVALAPGASVELSDGDRIRLGRYEFVAELREPAEPVRTPDAIDRGARPTGVRAPTAATLPSVSVTLAADAVASPEDLLRALAEGLQIDPAALDPSHPVETVRLAGQLLRSAIEGIRRQLQGRAESSDPSPGDERPTMVGDDCNPLEHAGSATDALRYLLDLRRHDAHVFMRPQEALDASLSQLVTNPSANIKQRPA
jgi:predicted component of type VI protein secretion system